jgi:hypothetical protein
MKDRVRIFINGCLITEGLWKRFGTASIGIFDAGRIRIACTRSVDHILFDQIEKLRFSVFIRKLGTNEAINFLWGFQL